MKIIKVRFEICKGCGNPALLVEGNDYCMNRECKVKQEKEEMNADKD